jgi:hypothetical protein
MVMCFYRWVNNQGWRLEYFIEAYGFTAVTVHKQNFTVEHFTYDTAFNPVLVYSFSRNKLI